MPIPKFSVQAKITFPLQSHKKDRPLFLSPILNRSHLASTNNFTPDHPKTPGPPPKLRAPPATPSTLPSRPPGTTANPLPHPPNLLKHPHDPTLTRHN
eukprot:gene15328-biopygen4238